MCALHPPECSIVFRRYNDLPIFRVRFRSCILVGGYQIDLAFLNIVGSLNYLICLRKRAPFLFLLVFEVKHRFLGFRVFVLFFLFDDFEQVWWIFLGWS